MDDVLKKQIQEAVDDVYICQLHHKYTAYLGVMVRDVLDHLMDRYGQIKPADLVANGEDTTSQWRYPSGSMHILHALMIAS
eukprot:1920192-Ditylum_brightwellii.AAC.1